MKRTLAVIVVVIMTLTLFMTSVFAAKPEKTQSEGPSKQEQKAAFKDATGALLGEMKANREEWGALGEQQDALSDSIEAKIAAIEANEYAISEEALLIVKADCEKIKAIQIQVRTLKKEIQDLWKQYIKAKKDSDIEAGVAALTSLVGKQETRIQLRAELISLLGELDLALSAPAAPAEGTGGEGAESPDTGE